MKIDVRWPSLPRWIAIALPCVLVALSIVSLAFTIVGVAAFAVWGVTRTKVITRGGGFRPMRYADLLDMAALNEIEVWEHNEAVARASKR